MSTNSIHSFFSPEIQVYSLEVLDSQSEMYPSHIFLKALKCLCDGPLTAPLKGKLSVLPPNTRGWDPFEPLEPLIEALKNKDLIAPDTIDLYLHIIPADGKNYEDDAVLCAARELIGWNLTGFLFTDIPVSALSKESLDKYIIGENQYDHVIDLLALGFLERLVESGQKIATLAKDAVFGMTVLTQYGPIDPVNFYAIMGDYLEYNPFYGETNSWNELQNGFAADEELYPYTILQSVKSSLPITDWRMIGDKQKNLWRKRLMKRVGLSVEDVPPFEFDYLDRLNIFQLEAVTEFYANFQEPWDSNTIPIEPDVSEDSDDKKVYQTVDLLDPTGLSAELLGEDDDYDILIGDPPATFNTKEIEPKYDSIYLENASGQELKIFKITKKESAETGNSFKLKLDWGTTDGNPPAFTDTVTPWRLILRPTLILIDPFGSRVSGKEAKKNNNDSTKIELHDVDDSHFEKINPWFDTISLPGMRDENCTGIFRITDKNIDNGKYLITLDCDHELNDIETAWHIQAGVGGKLLPLYYSLGPGGYMGYDHFEASLFIVCDNAIQGEFAGSSYTSRVYNKSYTTPQGSSSIRGNRQYFIHSRVTSNQAHNFHFYVGDADYDYKYINDVQYAKFYFQKQACVEEDYAIIPGQYNKNSTLGKFAILMHYSRYDKTITKKNTEANWIGSEGCLVSPVFPHFRTNIIYLFENYYLSSIKDKKEQRLKLLNELKGLNQESVISKWNKFSSPREIWKYMIKARLWLIRPDEKPAA